MNPWQVSRTTSFTACAEHCLVDGEVGLLIGRRDDEALVLWVAGESLLEAWVAADRVQQV